MKRSLQLGAHIAAPVAALSATVALASPAVAAPPVRFDYVQYDSPGNDTGTNASLNAEWIRIKNFGNSAKSLKGWTVRDKAGHVYKFGDFTLKAGKTVRIHTGKGANSSTDRYWKQDWYVWNNDGDKATLKNKAKTRIDTCKWGDGDGNTAC